MLHFVGATLKAHLKNVKHSTWQGQQPPGPLSCLPFVNSTTLNLISLSRLKRHQMSWVYRIDYPPLSTFHRLPSACCHPVNPYCFSSFNVSGFYLDKLICNPNRKTDHERKACLYILVNLVSRLAFRSSFSHLFSYVKAFNRYLSSTSNGTVCNNRILDKRPHLKLVFLQLALCETFWTDYHGMTYRNI